MQALTRRMTQLVLSVKSVGTTIPDFSQYVEQVRHHWIGKQKEALRVNQELAELIGEAKKCDLVSEIDKAFTIDGGPWTESGGHHEPLLWQQWFYAPYELLALLHPKVKGNPSADIQFAEIDVPLDDLRARPWIVRGAELPEESVVAHS